MFDANINNFRYMKAKSIYTAFVERTYFNYVNVL